MEERPSGVEVLKRLYVDEGLSLRQVAERLGPPASKRTVQRALQRAGVTLRPPRPPAAKQELMSRELLEQLYVDEGRNLDEVAAVVGVNVTTVKARMRALGIPRRKGAWRRVGDRQPMTRDLLHELRVVQQLPAADIARALGYSEIQVRSALHRHGIELAGHRTSLAGRLGPGELWWLHQHEGQAIFDIARRLRTSTQAVRDRMDELGVAVSRNRRPGRPSRRPAGVPAPDDALLEAVWAEAALVPRRQAVRRPIDEVEPEELRRLHHDEGLGLTAIGARFGCPARTIRARLEAADTEVRHRRGRRGVPGIAPDRLDRLAGLYGRPGLVDALGRHGVPVRVDGEPPDPPVDLTSDLVRDLYEDLGLSAADIALLTARSSGAVSRALRHHGVEARRHVPRPPAGGDDPPRLERDTLAALAAEGRDATSIARSLRLPSPTTVRIAAQVLEVTLPGDGGRPPVPSRVVREIRRAGVTPEHAAVVLDPRHVGLGAGRGLPPWPWPPDPSLLRHLYRSLGIGLAECADRLRCDVDDLKTQLVSTGVDLRRLDAPEPSKRWRLDPAELRRLYVDEGRRVEEIAERIGVDHALVYRALHRHHLPVAPSGKTGEPRVRYDELLADGRVRTALADSGLTPAGADPPIRRTSLPPGLLATLLGELGLSAFDVELLTGRLARAVREDSTAAGIEPRLLPPGVTAERLRDLYEVRGWSMSQICQELGLRSHGTLRVALRRAGIPRRTERARPAARSSTGARPSG